MLVSGLFFKRGCRIIEPDLLGALLAVQLERSAVSGKVRVAYVLRASIRSGTKDSIYIFHCVEQT